MGMSVLLVAAMMRTERIYEQRGLMDNNTLRGLLEAKNLLTSAQIINAISEASQVDDVDVAALCGVLLALDDAELGALQDFVPYCKEKGATIAENRKKSTN